MAMRWGLMVVATAFALVAGSAGCSAGDSAGSQGSSSAVVPTVTQLQRALLVPRDLTGDWEVEAEGTQGGMIELCAEAGAESKLAAADLAFQTGVRLRKKADPGATGAVSVVEYLLAGPDQDVQETFEALQAGARACYGKPLVPDEGYGTNEPYELPAVGDARYGEYHVMASDQPGYGSYLHMAVVREGPVLMLLNAWEFLGSEGAQPQVTAKDVGTIATTAVAKLP